MTFLEGLVSSIHGHFRRGGYFFLSSSSVYRTSRIPPGGMLYGLGLVPGTAWQVTAQRDELRSNYSSPNDESKVNIYYRLGLGLCIQEASY